jgi:hypothetical protein
VVFFPRVIVEWFYHKQINRLLFLGVFVHLDHRGKVEKLRDGNLQRDCQRSEVVLCFRIWL